MAKYKILVKRSAAEELKKTLAKDIAKITEKIQPLSDEPRPPGREKLAAKNAYRIRQGLYRIIYTAEDDIQVVIVIKIGHRRYVYR